MRKMVTLRERVPWSWVVLMTGPWAAYSFVDNATTGGPLVFTIRRYVESPVLVGLLSSLHVAFGCVLGVGASYLSDRIWTRTGRRRPFLIAGWTGVVLALVGLPLASQLGALIAVVVLFQISQSVANPLEPLCNEVIPPLQRGRAATLRNLLQNVTGLFFHLVLLAQFDRRYSLFGVLEITGAHVLYWAGAAIVAASVLFVAFGVEEGRPAGAAAREPFTPLAFCRDVFGDRRWWPVYLLYVAPAISGVGGDSFTPLMRTEQLGFSKEQLGQVVSLAIVAATVAIVPLAGWLADRVSRLWLFQLGILGPALVNFALFLLVRFRAGEPISFGTLLGFPIATALLQAFLWVSWGPLIYDYIPADRFGTVSAGLSLVGSLAPFVMINLAGLWVGACTHLFGPAGLSRQDYSSIYVLHFGGAFAATLIIRYFARQEKCGRVLAYGRADARLPAVT